jgi:hypothetical protein
MNPDEIWIIQIDPEEKSKEPKSIPRIEERRNELSGNTSLNQELYFVRSTNELVEQLGKWEHNEARIPRKVLDVCLQRRINELVERLGKQEDDYTEILSGLQAVLDAPDEYGCGETHVITKVRRIELTLDKGYQSKMDRSLANIKTLLKHGCEQAHLFQRLLLSQIAFEETWEKALRDKEERGVKDVAAVMDFFGQDSTIELLPPVDPVTGLAKTEGWKTGDLGQVQKVLEWCLDCNFTIEQSRDYLEEDSPDKGKVFSCWVLATADGFDEPIKGRVKVATQGGKVERFSFYPLRMKVMEKLRKKLEQICREA